MVTFKDMNESIEYKYKCSNSIVSKEKLRINDVDMLVRNEKGEGDIFSKEENKKLKYKISTNELAVKAKKDSIQHPFLDSISEWGNAVRHYQFGTELSKNTFIVKINNNNPFMQKVEDIGVAAFVDGKKQYGDEFVNLILDDMRKIGYYISDIGVEQVAIPINAGMEPVLGLFVQEESLRCKTNQINMSQGMFIALDLIIQVK